MARKMSLLLGVLSFVFLASTSLTEAKCRGCEKGTKGTEMYPPWPISVKGSKGVEMYPPWPPDQVKGNKGDFFPPWPL